MSDLSFLEGQYDIILSSLAVHYLEDFCGFVRQVGSKLRPGGYIFSQEHPLNTSNPRGRFVRDEKGHVTGFTLENYLVGGRRTETWFIDDVTKYHRTFSDVINALASAGFAVMRMSEPTLDEKAAANDPEKEQKKEKRLHKPLFLIVKAVKL